MTRTIDIVFSDMPGPIHPSIFIEVERDGHSISCGEWVDRNDGTWALRIPDHEAIREEVIRLAKESIAGQERNVLSVHPAAKDALRSENWALQILRAQLARVLAPLGFDLLK